MSVSKLFGIHAVEAALDYSPEKIIHIWVDTQRQDKRLSEVLEKLAKQGINAEKTDRKKLDRFADGKNHQGIMAEVKLPEMKTEAQLKDAITSASGVPFFLVLDHIQDPHNLGACLRSADAANLNGIIITKDNATGITPTVCKV
ncbi:MAG: 23S rRNA (guanosine(2251)-2'-O)-methyltransferase RlmB, partial [Methylococcaceae bacterium]|nr:23S rRNA (guanosine(2251)-2'-O)-methyltransferase RlmB [Methylococcaceae bacterium]